MNFNGRAWYRHDDANRGKNTTSDIHLFPTVFPLLKEPAYNLMQNVYCYGSSSYFCTGRKTISNW